VVCCGVYVAVLHTCMFMRVLWVVVACCRILQGVAGCCRVLQSVAECVSVLLNAAVYCSELHYVYTCSAECCSMLQCAA